MAAKTMTTKRIEDINGWIEVKDNPISKVGVFEYSGAQIGAPEPNRIYKVYRPAEELSDPETIASFKLLPLVDDHTMLGSSDEGMTPAEKKGVQGVIGENVYFKHPFLKANIKIFSESLRKQIDDGKIDLSGGYRCQYDFTPGVFEGEKYDAIQRRPRGNHLALVDEGRMGNEVVVQDSFTFTVDAKDTQVMDNEKLIAALEAALAAAKEGKTLSGDEATALGSVVDAMCNKDESQTTEPPAKDTDNPPAEPTKDEDTPPATPTAPAAGDDEGAEDEDDDETEDEGEGVAPTLKDEVVDAVVKEIVGTDKKFTGMDAAIRKAVRKVVKAKAPAKKPKKQAPPVKAFDAREFLSEVAERDKLATGLSKVIGTFDHSKMTAEDVAVYGAKKLGLSVKPEHARTAVAAYLQGVSKVPTQPVSTGMDQRSSASFVSKYIEGK